MPREWILYKENDLLKLDVYQIEKEKKVCIKTIETKTNVRDLAKLAYDSNLRYNWGDNVKILESIEVVGLKTILDFYRGFREKQEIPPFMIF